MNAEELSKTIREIVEKHGAYPALRVETEVGRRICVLKALYKDRVEIIQFASQVIEPPDETCEDFMMPAEMIVSIRHVTTVELVDTINKLRSTMRFGLGAAKQLIEHFGVTLDL